MKFSTLLLFALIACAVFAQRLRRLDEELEKEEVLPSKVRITPTRNTQTPAIPQPPAPEPVKQPEPPKAPETKVPEAPKTPEPVKTPEAPKVPELPKTPEPVKPETPKQPEAPKAPETPKVPEPVKTPEAPKTTEPVKTPEPPKQPEVPKAPETPQVPKVPEQPQNTQRRFAGRCIHNDRLKSLYSETVNLRRGKKVEVPSAIWKANKKICDCEAERDAYKRGRWERALRVAIEICSHQRRSELRSRDEAADRAQFAIIMASIPESRRKNHDDDNKRKEHKRNENSRDRRRDDRRKKDD